MKIATWNVNSIRSRLPHLLRWLKETRPDVVLLQEIKTPAPDFPALEIESAGYAVVVAGQKSYNGVAVLSKRPITEARPGLPGDPTDEQARYLEVTIDGMRMASVYAPNGNPVPGDKYDYKLTWMERMLVHARALLETGEPFILGGDWNIAPTNADVHDPQAWRSDALCLPTSRAAWRRLTHLGLTDALDALPTTNGRYTWWDYRAGAWPRDEGLRIDHFLLSPRAADRLRATGVDRAPRGWDKPSDHTPAWCELAEPLQTGMD